MAQVVFWTLVGAWIALEVFLHAAYNPRIRQSGREKASKYVMLVAFLFSVLAGRLFFPDFGPRFLGPFGAVRVAGLVLFACSLGLRGVAVRQLGKGYSVNLGVREGQPLVTTGLYSVVRHPGYMSLMIGFIGIAMCYSQLFPSLICVVVPAAAIGWRIHVEEAILEEAYGGQYRAYRARVRAIVPGML
jgi:protein-S-isoprenylcysteine O-methyltransferase Ste14